MMQKFISNFKTWAEMLEPLEDISEAEEEARGLQIVKLLPPNALELPFFLTGSK